MKTSPNSPDLAFLGTGCRAAAFHLGTLIMLDEPGMLLKINVLSAISDGAITGAGCCINQASVII